MFLDAEKAVIVLDFPIFKTYFQDYTFPSLKFGSFIVFHLKKTELAKR